MSFLDELRQQRWDDHRYYHQSLINQTLHLISACSFLAAYAYLFIDPVKAAVLGWLVAMVSRQSGHFFFEPKGYDTRNDVSHEYKEAIKVGYNLRRKVVLHAVWALTPLLLWLRPDMFGLLTPYSDRAGYFHDLALVWIGLGAAALVLRTVHLFFIRDVQAGLVWCTKILTDPVHDITLYYRAPLQLLQGRRADAMARP